jgi:DNA-binding LytR/AlgR family response regulator
MNKYKCLVVDDEEMATRVIVSHLEHLDNFEVSGIYHSPVNAYLALEKEKIDVLFLDIQMPKMTGLSMLKMLQQKPLTILTTAHRDYALEGFELDVVDYLVKPIGLDRFLKSMMKVNKWLNAEKEMHLKPQHNENYVMVKSDRRQIKLFFDDILYVEAIKNHIRIFTKDRSLISLIGISEFLDKLPQNQFIKIHRSYLINIRQISSFDKHEVIIKSKTLPVGRSFKDATRSFLNLHL